MVRIHAVEQRDRDGGLALLTWPRKSPEPPSDQVLVSADGDLDEVAPAVSRSLLADSARLICQADVAVPRRSNSRVLRAQNR